jgi:hypothetical protein
MLKYHQWEFYFYNIIFGLFQAPYYAVSHSSYVFYNHANHSYYNSMHKQ